MSQGVEQLFKSSVLPVGIRVSTICVCVGGLMLPVSLAVRRLQRVGHSRSEQFKEAGLANHKRGILLGVVLLLVLMRLPLVSILVLSLWVGVETFLFCRRFGKRGNVALLFTSVAIAAFLSFQGYVLWQNLQLISAIEARGASSAAMSGNLLPGVVNYVSLGRQVEDDKLAHILELDGLESLETVVANGSKITDTGLLMLGQFENLRHIYIRDTKVTHNGVDQLESALPNCLIVFDVDE